MWKCSIVIRVGTHSGLTKLMFKSHFCYLPPVWTSASCINSKRQFPHLWNGDLDNTYLADLLGKLSKTKFCKFLGAYCLLGYRGLQMSFWWICSVPELPRKPQWALPPTHLDINPGPFSWFPQKKKQPLHPQPCRISLTLGPLVVLLKIGRDGQDLLLQNLNTLNLNIGHSCFPLL